MLSHVHEVYVKAVSSATFPNNDPTSTWQENAMETECQGQESGYPHCLAFICSLLTPECAAHNLNVIDIIPSGNSMLLWWKVDPEGGIVVYVL